MAKPKKIRPTPFKVSETATARNPPVTAYKVPMLPITTMLSGNAIAPLNSALNVSTTAMVPEYRTEGMVTNP